MAIPKKSQLNKRYLKFLSICNNGKLNSQIIRSAPDHVIKSICNATLNAIQGDVHLSKKQKQLFRNNRSILEKLVDHKLPISKKKKIIQSGKGLAILPILLSSVIGSLGSLLFKSH